ncbi:MAG: hypothetical protein JXQ23_10915, partial [Clostridia bacterium]|nr:hypothetical protein [Clostridia bacterium]
MDKVNFGSHRWEIIYGSYSGSEKVAVDIIHDAIQKFVPYILVVTDSHEVSEESLSTVNPIFIGTPDSNPFIKDMVQLEIIHIADV